MQYILCTLCTSVHTMPIVHSCTAYLKVCAGVHTIKKVCAHGCALLNIRRYSVHRCTHEMKKKVCAH